MFDLPTIWAVIIAFAILMYVILDGFDLGIGILFPTLDKGKQRDIAMNTVAPVWDGNETWLVLGGGGLMAAFPLAFAVIIPAVYAPITAMLLGLVLRGVAFEYRWRDKAHEKFWDLAFWGGSLIAAFSQGVVLGAFVQGINVEGRQYAGGWLDWLSPFSVFTGIALVTGYAFLGACYLIMKTNGLVRDAAYKAAKPLFFMMMVLVGLVSLFTPMLDAEIAARWYTMPGLLYLAPVPILVAVIGFALWRKLSKRQDYWPFPLALALFGLCFAGLGVAIYPYIVPRVITVAEAASPDKSLGFMLIGGAILLPLILAYTAYSYWVFRGKVTADSEGYH